MFEAVVALDPAQRTAILRDVRAYDPSMVSEVEGLLSAYGRRDGFIEKPLAEVNAILSAGEVETPDSSIAGTVVGSYQLVELIGSGGMGEVWFAQQRHPVQRRVAVKLIKAGMASRELVARFESERQAVALMEHPAIAKVYDAGSTPDGRPYFAMEYVAGLPITTYCDRHQLSLRERLQLFMRVCGGVQHAHQKAIIHRDLKPSNILVVQIDGKPFPKIIDFGVARVTGQKPASPANFLTQTGAILGTPDYMSPEQANSGGEDIDTRTDVYSLGVILYELLAGVLPFDFRKLPLEQILRTLRETDVPRPSVRLRSHAGLSAISRNRQSQPDKLVRQLRGDLDAITLNALEKERSNRYASPSELAADIGRYLRSEPIAARPANVVYRARKYVRRHGAVLASALLAMLLLASFGIVEAIQLRRITRERDRADRIAGFMIGMFRVSDPGESRGNSITAREILDRSTKGIATGLARDPELQSQMMEVMGSVYASLGLYPQAEFLLDRTVQLRRRILGQENPATAQSMGALANILHAEGRHVDGLKLDEQTFAIRRRRLGPEHPDTLKSMNSLAMNLIDANRYGEAERLHRKILEIRLRVLGPEHPDTLRTLDNLGKTLDEEGRYTEAEALERRALETRRRVLGPDHPDTLHALHHLADTLYGEGRYAEAEKLHREEMNEYRRVLGPEHNDTLSAMDALANALDDEGKYGEAESLERQAIDVQTRVLGPEHPHTMIALNNLAEILGDEGRYAEAEKIHRAVAASRARILGREHAHTLYSMSKLAWVLILQGRLEEAEQLSRQARDGQVKVLGPDHPDTAESIYNLACIAARRGKSNEALVTLRASLDHGLKPRAILRIPSDSSLRSLRGDREFDLLVANARKRAVARYSNP